MQKSREAFRTISEVSEWLDTPAHVLRFWESKFTQIKPVKRAGGRRYYRPDDMALLGGIKTLLHEQGMTIKGVQKMLREQGVRHVAGLGPQPVDADDWVEGDIPAPVTAVPDAAPPDTALPAANTPAKATPAPPVQNAPQPAPSRAADPMPPLTARVPQRPGLIAAIRAADPARLVRARKRLAPLVSSLAALRLRLILE